MLVAALATYDGGDSAHLRYSRTSLTTSGVRMATEPTEEDVLAQVARILPDPATRISRVYPPYGSQTLKTLPSPTVLSRVICPAWASTISLAIANPSPVPPYRRAMLPSTW